MDLENPVTLQRFGEIEVLVGMGQPPIWTVALQIKSGPKAEDIARQLAYTSDLTPYAVAGCAPGLPTRSFNAVLPNLPAGVPLFAGWDALLQFVTDHISEQARIGSKLLIDACPENGRPSPMEGERSMDNAVIYTPDDLSFEAVLSALEGAGHRPEVSGPPRSGAPAMYLPPRLVAFWDGDSTRAAERVWVYLRKAKDPWPFPPWGAFRSLLTVQGGSVLFFDYHSLEAVNSMMASLIGLVRAGVVETNSGGYFPLADLPEFIRLGVNWDRITLDAGPDD